MLPNEIISKSPDFIDVEILQLKGVQIESPFSIRAGDFGMVSFDNIPSEFSLFHMIYKTRSKKFWAPRGAPRGSRMIR
jgi:hypothetical protein